MRVETITRNGKEFALIPVRALQKLMEDAEMLADVKAYDAAKARLDDGSDELIPLEITERRLKGEPALRIWREHRKLTQEQLAKKARERLAGFIVVHAGMGSFDSAERFASESFCYAQDDNLELIGNFRSTQHRSPE